MKKFLLITTCVLTSLLLFACAKTVDTNVSETNKEAVEKMEEKIENNEIDLNRFIEDVLLTHYDEQFGYTENYYKTTGYKVLKREALSDTEFKVYLIANYMEYDEIDGEIKNVAGSGPTALALTINLKGMGSKVDYEVLTENEIGSEKYNEAFPEDVREKINPISEKDRNEVIEKQEKKLNEQIKEEMGEEEEETEEEEEEEETEEEIDEEA